jgi:hypothetical protein
VPAGVSLLHGVLAGVLRRPGRLPRGLPGLLGRLRSCLANLPSRLPRSRANILDDTRRPYRVSSTAAPTFSPVWVTAPPGPTACLAAPPTWSSAWVPAPPGPSAVCAVWPTWSTVRDTAPRGPSAVCAVWPMSSTAVSTVLSRASRTAARGGCLGCLREGGCGSG